MSRPSSTPPIPSRLCFSELPTFICRLGSKLSPQFPFLVCFFCCLVFLLLCVSSRLMSSFVVKDIFECCLCLVLSVVFCLFLWVAYRLYRTHLSEGFTLRIFIEFTGGRNPSARHGPSLRALPPPYPPFSAVHARIRLR